MLTPPSNLPERRRRSSGAPGANRFGRDFESERNLSATGNSIDHTRRQWRMCWAAGWGPRWQAGVARGYEARSLSSSFIHACVNSHGAVRVAGVGSRPHGLPPTFPLWDFCDTWQMFSPDHIAGRFCCSDVAIRTRGGVRMGVETILLMIVILTSWPVSCWTAWP